jgi:hypothetical protein
VINSGFNPNTNVICGLSAPFSKDIVVRAKDERTTVRSASINAQPEFTFINVIAQHSKLFFNSIQLTYYISE